jgi:hypothetical protein
MVAGKEWTQSQLGHPMEMGILRQMITLDLEAEEVAEGTHFSQ